MLHEHMPQSRRSESKLPRNPATISQNGFRYANAVKREVANDITDCDSYAELGTNFEELAEYDRVDDASAFTDAEALSAPLTMV